MWSLIISFFKFSQPTKSLEIRTSAISSIAITYISENTYYCRMHKLLFYLFYNLFLCLFITIEKCEWSEIAKTT